MNTILKAVVILLLIEIYCCSLVVLAFCQETRWQKLNNKLEQLFQQGKYAEAIPVAKEVLRVAEKTYGKEAINTATSLNNLAELYRLQRQYIEAEQLHKQALAIREKTLGPEHPHVAISLNNLAFIFQAQSRYAEAEQICQRALTIRKKVLGPEHPDVAVSLNNLAGLYEAQGRSTKAEPLYKQALAIREKILGPEHPEVAKTLSNLATLYQAQERYAEVEPLLKREIAIKEKTLGSENVDIANRIASLAAVYLKINRYPEAESLYKRALAIREKVLGTEHLDVAMSLNELAAFYSYQGRYAEAEQQFKRGLTIYKKVLGPWHWTVARSLNILANICSSQGRYTEAESLYKQAVAIREKVAGPERPNVVEILNNLASLYQEQHRYDKSEQLLKRILTIQEKALGPEHPEMVNSLRNLAFNYESQKRYSEAEMLFKQALEIRKKVLGAEHVDVSQSIADIANLYLSEGGRLSEAELLFKQALSINEESSMLINLAFIYQLQDRDEEAESLFKRALILAENAYGSEHPIVSSCLLALAKHYLGQKRYAEAEPFVKKALAIREKVNGLKNFNVARILSTLASLYSAQGNYAVAESLFQRVLAIDEEVLDGDNFFVARDLEYLAGIYYVQGNYAASESLLSRAISIQEKDRNPRNYLVVEDLFKLAWHYVETGRLKDALPLMIRGLNFQENTIKWVFSISSEQEKLSYMERSSSFFGALLNLTWQESMGNQDAIIASLNATLKHKGVVLEALSREWQALTTSANSQVVQTVQQLQSISSYLAAITFAGPGYKSIESYRQCMNAFAAERDSLEKALAKLSSVYDAERKSRQVDYQSVSQALPSGSVLLEFVFTPIFNFKAKGTENHWSESQYLVFILPAGKDAKPLLVWLGPAKAISGAVQEFRREISCALDDIPVLGEAEAERRLAEKGRNLYNLIFAPLKSAIGDNKAIFLSPDGDLNLIPFAALQDESGQYLAESYQFNYLSSGRDLVRYHQYQEKGNGVIILADANFNLSSDERLVKKQNLLSKEVQLVSHGSERSTNFQDVFWQPLPGTWKEAEAISRLFKKEKVRLYTGDEALEEVFKNAHSPKILHLATHGFFLPEQNTSKWQESAEQKRGFTMTESDSFPASLKIENPLLRSGLVLAGANCIGKDNLDEGAEDGVLTALEISGIPLWGTDLVVLSACETGLGEIKMGEGVFGLRRAFQLVGARTVVMSLWKVPDEETRQLMTDFYGRMLAGGGKSRALQEASLALMKERREKFGAAHPYFWSAFVCVGEP